ncbi:MAG: hypothetical protein RI907_2209 [Pseudomonadota bacterium]|jgi:general secretion pathway protein C
MASRFFALVVWAAVAASVAYWGLRWFSRPAAVPAHATPVTLDAAVKGDMRRLLSGPAQPASGPAQAMGEAQTLISRLKLLGIVAPRNESDPAGIALLSLDGKPARAVRIGTAIDGTFVLRTLTQRSAGIGPADGPVAASLDLPPLPPPATGMQPAPTGVMRSATPPSLADMQSNTQIGTAQPAIAPVAPPPAVQASIGSGGAAMPKSAKSRSARRQAGQPGAPGAEQPGMPAPGQPGPEGGEPRAPGV